MRPKHKIGYYVTVPHPGYEPGIHYRRRAAMRDAARMARALNCPVFVNRFQFGKTETLGQLVVKPDGTIKRGVFLSGGWVQEWWRMRAFSARITRAMERP